MTATQPMLDLVKNLGPDALVLALFSGGGSALLCAPSEGLTLEYEIAVNRSLLAAGAPICDMNILRKRLSRIKGRQMAAASYPARSQRRAGRYPPPDSLRPYRGRKQYASQCFGYTIRPRPKCSATGAGYTCLVYGHRPA